MIKYNLKMDSISIMQPHILFIKCKSDKHMIKREEMVKRGFESIKVRYLRLELNLHHLLAVFEHIDL